MLYHCDGTLSRTHDAAMAAWDRWARVADALRITADAFYSMMGR